jgi:ubiquinone/menaquinone biosynthesis C-methylase UbiE
MSNEKKRDNDNKAGYNDEWLHTARFPRSAKYDVAWMLANEMGPNPLWLLEEVTEQMGISPDDRVMDLGCGRGLTSVFLAREYEARVFATDLWINPDDNWGRFVEAGLADRICPVHSEAHDLPYAAGFFDAAVSIDAYQYFGTDDLYLGYLTRFVKPGGRIGLVMPSLTREFATPPEHLTRIRPTGTAFWDPTECWCFHTLEWWTRHLERPGLVKIESAEVVEDGWKLWRDWERVRDGGGFTGFPSEADTLTEDAGRNIGFVSFVLEVGPRGTRAFDHPLKIRL